MLLLGFFEGLYTIEVKNEDARATFSTLLAHTVRAKSTRRMSNGVIHITLFSSDYKRFCSYVEAGECPRARVVERWGVPRLLQTLKKRPGIAIGTILGALLLFLSTQIVWRVDILCPDNAYAREEDKLDLASVNARLQSLGIEKGMALSGFDSRHAERQFLIDQGDVSWIAINRRGTVLSVEVRPSYQIEHDDRGSLIPNGEGYLEGTVLVANADGIIVRTELRNGTSQVATEQMVTKGEVLASGILESVDGDVRFSRVSGKVFAKTVRELSVTVPLHRQETAYSGESELTRCVRLFGYEIPLPRVVKSADENVTFLEIFQNHLGNSGFSAPEYDIIEDEKILSLPDGTELPISYVTRMKNGKETKAVWESRESALAIAQKELSAMRDGMTDAQIFGIARVIEETQDAVTVIWYVDCIDNIASVVPFTVRADGEITPQ